MEYVRRLLEEKQVGFSTSVELAVSFIHRQIEWPEETMELTLPPGPHETVEKQDPVHAWRVARLARLGISGRWPKLPPAMSTGTRWRRWCSGAALRGSHSASSADTARATEMNALPDRIPVRGAPRAHLGRLTSGRCYGSRSRR